MNNKGKLNILLHYDAVGLFQEEFYKNLLTSANLIDGETLFKALSDEDGNTIDGATIPGYPLLKDGVKYILKSKTLDHKTKEVRQIDLGNDLPLMVTGSKKIFSSGVGYSVIDSFSVAKFKPEKKMTFRELIDFIAFGIPKSNQTHATLFTIMSIMSVMDRVNFRLATPPGFGKDSMVEICGSLFGACTAIEDPTMAKLEYLSHSHWLAINEVVGIAPGDWKKVSQYLLKAGALKTKVPKRSRAVKGVEETLDITKLSLALFYNDISEYIDEDEYFDNVATGPIKDRFLPFRFYGHMTAKFDDVGKYDIRKVVIENMDTYRNLIVTFEYYKKNMLECLNNYEVGDMNLKQRHTTAMNRILRGVDLYCKDQTEFDMYKQALLDARSDYEDMDGYPLIWGQAMKKIELLSYTVRDGESESEYDRTKRFIKNSVDKINLFKNKKKFLNKFLADMIEIPTNETLDTKREKEESVTNKNDFSFWEKK